MIHFFLKRKSYICTYVCLLIEMNFEVLEKCQISLEIAEIGLLRLNSLAFEYNET